MGFTLDGHLNMNVPVSNIAQTCYFELRRLAFICRFPTSTATATLASAFVLSRIDYCNSLLFGSTHDVTSHLQLIQNYAAWVILRLPKSSSITIHIKSLHCQSKKHLQNSLFVLPLSQHYCTIICHWHAAEIVNSHLQHLQHLLQLIHLASSQ